ncbi:MAG: metallophosphoesterase family protein [Bacillota bacterium]|nr:metallophosphoesterase family protein [Bacillota bacterium]
MGRFPKSQHRHRKEERWGRLSLALAIAATAGIAAVGIFSMSVRDGGLLTESRAPEGTQTREEIRAHQQAAEDQNDRQVVLSMGQTSDILFLSWKGSKKDGGVLRISRDMYDLPYAEPVEARKTRILQSDYYRYSVRLTDLEAGETYYYEIGDGFDFDAPRTFETPREKRTCQFLYLGDVQFEKSMDDYDRWQQMVQGVYDSDVRLDFGIIGGDMVNFPTELKQWDRFLGSCGVFSSLPLMTVPGNHEGVHSSLTYKKLFAMPHNGPKESKEDFYFFDYGSCRFIMMDSSFLTDARKEKLGEAVWEQRERAIEGWLVKVAADSRKPWTVVVIHHPPYGMHDYHTVSADIRKLWTPIMEQEDVDLVLSGHQHMYMRTRDIKGITYVMGNSGAKGSEYYNGYNAPLYAEALYGDGPNYQIITATPTRLTLRSYNEKGLAIDETSLEKGLRFHIFEFFRGS